MELPPSLKRFFNLTQSLITTATTASRNRNRNRKRNSSTTEPDLAGSEMARQNYLKAKISACYAMAADLWSPIHRLPAVATAVSDRVVLACRQPLTIGTSLADAFGVFGHITSSEAFVLSIVAFCLWYTATALLEWAVLGVLSLHALPNKIQAARGVWDDGLVTLLQTIVDVGYFFITLILVLLMIVALSAYAKPAAAETRSAPAPASRHQSGVQLPLIDGHIRKPPGAAYAERPAPSPITTEKQATIPGARVYPDPIPSPERNGNRRGSNASICGRPAYFCREQARQFQNLLNTDETIDAEKRRELAAVRLADKSKGREIERLGVELNSAVQEQAKTAGELDSARAEVARVTEMLTLSEELAGPESKELFDKLHADLAAANQATADAKQQIEAEKAKHQILLDDAAEWRTHIEGEIEFCQHASAAIAEKLTGKLLLARSEAREVVFMRREVQEWKRKHAEVSTARYHVEKRLEDAEARREDCYGRMVRAEERMREMEERLRGGDGVTAAA